MKKTYLICIKGEINGDFDNYVTSYPLYMHEFGHYLDSRVWGPLFSFAVGIPSLISAGSSETTTLGISNHDYFWTEKRANRKAADYFGKYYGINWLFSGYPIGHGRVKFKKTFFL